MHYSKKNPPKNLVVKNLLAEIYYFNTQKYKKLFTQVIDSLTKECDFEIANLYYKKIHYSVVNKYRKFKDKNKVDLFFW